MYVGWCGVVVGCGVLCCVVVTWEMLLSADQAANTRKRSAEPFLPTRVCVCVKRLWGIAREGRRRQETPVLHKCHRV